MVSSLVLLYFDRPPIRYTIKQTEEYKTNFFGRREPDFKVSKFYDLFRDLGKFKLQNLSKSSTVVWVIFWNVHKIKTKLQHKSGNIFIIKHSKRSCNITSHHLSKIELKVKAVEEWYKTNVNEGIFNFFSLVLCRLHITSNKMF